MADESVTNIDDITSPGKLLRTHREKLELSAEEIAKRVHLDIKVIEAIEDDNYGSMPSPIYVRGYLRSYAKVVGADAEHVIGIYNADTPSELPEILPEVKPPTQASSSDKPVKAFTYLISLGLVLLLLVWYQSNFVVETIPTEQQDVGDNTIDTINGVDTTFTVVHHPEGWQTPADEEIEKELLDAQQIELESEQQVELQDQQAEAVSMEDIESEYIKLEDAALELQTDNGEESLGILPIENMEKSGPEIVTTAGPDSIKLELSSDSWVEIYDVNDERLFLDLAIAGEQYLINGTAPFRVLLGFSQGVLVEFNGEKIDHSPYSRNGIARFSLPE